MDYQTIAFIEFLIIAYASYSAYKLKDQIWCSFRRRDNTKIEKFATSKQARIDFDNGWYEVMPQYTQLVLWTKGIHLLLPTWVRSLDYRWDSSKPLNPKDFNNDWGKDDPEVKKSLDKSRAVQQIFQGNKNAMGGKVKLGRLEQYMPLLMIGGLVVMGYFIWNMQAKIDLLGAGQNAIQGLIGQYMKGAK